MKILNMPNPIQILKLNCFLQTKSQLKQLNRELQDKITQLEIIISEQSELIKNYETNSEYVHKLNNELNGLLEKYQKPTKNERGAGRKTIITEELINKVNHLKNKDITQREIAEELQISIGLVNKICKMI